MAVNQGCIFQWLSATNFGHFLTLPVANDLNLILETELHFHTGHRAKNVSQFKMFNSLLIKE